MSRWRQRRASALSECLAEAVGLLIAGAFESITEVEPQGIFTDVAVDTWYAAAVEGLAASGVTQGCIADPRSYCPDDKVTRDQTASFLARVLVVP